MGQDIKYIATAETIALPKKIIHFKIKSFTIIPLPIDDFSFQELMEQAQELKQATDFYTFISDWEPVDRDLWSDPIEEIAQTSREIFNAFLELQLQSFGIFYIREFMDLPQNLGPSTIYKNGTLIDMNDYSDPYKFAEVAADAGNIIPLDSIYWSFEDCEDLYLKENTHQA